MARNYFEVYVRGCSTQLLNLLMEMQQKTSKFLYLMDARDAYLANSQRIHPQSAH